MKDHRMMFQEDRWVLHGLWPLDSDNNILRRCITPSMRFLGINYDHLNEDLKTVLKTEWPVLTINGTDKSNIETEYREYGTCVTDDPSSYFEKALELVSYNNVSRILRNGLVGPGTWWFPYYLNDIIKGATTKNAILECVRSKRPEMKEQYILQIRICFNSAEKAIDCPRTSEHIEHECDKWEDIKYPSVPPTYYYLMKSWAM